MAGCDIIDVAEMAGSMSETRWVEGQEPAIIKVWFGEGR